MFKSVAVKNLPCNNKCSKDSNDGNDSACVLKVLSNDCNYAKTQFKLTIRTRSAREHIFHAFIGLTQIFPYLGFRQKFLERFLFLSSRATRSWFKYLDRFIVIEFRYILHFAGMSNEVSLIT